MNSMNTNQSPGAPQPATVPITHLPAHPRYRELCIHRVEEIRRLSLERMDLTTANWMSHITHVANRPGQLN